MAKATVVAPKASKTAPKAPPKAAPSKAPTAAPKATQAPQAAGRKGPPTATPKPNGAPAPTQKSDAPSIDSGALKAMRAELDKATAEIARLSKLVAKANAKPTNTRTIGDILNGAKLAKGDWREAYHGWIANVQHTEFTKKNDPSTFRVMPELPSAMMLLALPRDSDVGGMGASARNQGLIAVYQERLEDGVTFKGIPQYLNEEELAAAYLEDQGAAEWAPDLVTEG